MFGIPGAVESAALVYIPVPWEVTTSYGKGTSAGPETILRASPQLDLYLRGLDDHYGRGFYLDEADPRIAELNGRFKPAAEVIQGTLESRGSLAAFPDLEKKLAEINDASRQVNEIVYHRARELDGQGKLVALIGGDHSSPYGLVRYLAEKHGGAFGVLHIDAHHDLREGYQGFAHSHASIMYNLLDLPTPPEALVQVGIRDFSREEAELALRHPAVHTFYDEDIKERLFEGDPFSAVVGEIIDHLPENVYVSFDIDGLQPDLCPGTGTPVAGGLALEQAQYLIKQLVRAKRRIVGFDLCEVAPNPASDSEWDGNVGARILFMLSSWMMESRKR